jgi:hypothetical protein
VAEPIFFNLKRACVKCLDTNASVKWRENLGTLERVCARCGYTWWDLPADRCDRSKEPELTIRARRVIQKLGCDHLRDLSDKRVDEVRLAPNCGPVTFEELTRELAILGLEMKP